MGGKVGFGALTLFVDAKTRRYTKANIRTIRSSTKRITGCMLASAAPAGSPRGISPTGRIRRWSGATIRHRLGAAPTPSRRLSMTISWTSKATLYRVPTLSSPTRQEEGATWLRARMACVRSPTCSTHGRDPSDADFDVSGADGRLL